MSLEDPSDAALNKGVSKFETLALWCGIAVAVGVGLEVLLALLHFPYDSSKEVWGTVAADILIALGVAGEVLFGQMASHRQSELQRRSGEKVAVLNKETADAHVLLERLRAQLGPRHIDIQKLAADLVGKPSAEIEIMASHNDGEAFYLALQIQSALIAAAWGYPKLSRIPANQLGSRLITNS